MRHSREFWEQLYAEHQASGIRHADLANKHRVNIHTLKDWFQRIRRGASAPMKQREAKLFVPVAVAAAPTERQPKAGWPLLVIVGDDCNAIASLLRRLQAE